MHDALADDDLTLFAAEGPPPLPEGGATIERDGARLWFGDYGSGPAVALLHGGLGNAGNFGHQVPALLARGYRVIAVDSCVMPLPDSNVIVLRSGVMFVTGSVFPCFEIHALPSNFGRSTTPTNHSCSFGGRTVTRKIVEPIRFRTR